MIGHDGWQIAVPPVRLFQYTYDGLELFLAHLHRLSRFTLLKGLTDAQNDVELRVESSTSFLRDHLRSFVEERSAFRMTF